MFIVGTPNHEADFISANNRIVCFQNNSITPAVEIEITADNFTENNEQFSVQLIGITIEKGENSVELSDQEMNRLRFDETVVTIIDDDGKFYGYQI